MRERTTEEAARALRAAPDGPMEHTMVWGSWSIQHKKTPGSWVHKDPPEGDPSWWFTSWAGSSHRIDNEAEAKEYRLEAEHAFDRGYPHDNWQDSRMLLKTETKTVKVERVPAMWEVPA